jgi:hypothetical protein
MRLLRHLMLRPSNYPLIIKQRKEFWDCDEKVTYLVSAVDGTFLTIGLQPDKERDVNGMLHELRIRETTLKDLENFSLGPLQK